MQLLQIPRQQDRRGRSPTVTKNYDVGASLLLLRQNAVVISIEQFENRLVSLFSVPVLKHTNASSLPKRLLHTPSELNWAMTDIVVPHKTTYEPYDNSRGGNVGPGHCRAFSRCKPVLSGKQRGCEQWDQRGTDDSQAEWSD